MDPRLITPEEIKEHDGSNGSFWAVIDGWVVDASVFLAVHPGGISKLLSTDRAATGATGKPFGFSFTHGREAHLPVTGRLFNECVDEYLRGPAQNEENKNENYGYLPVKEVNFPDLGTIVILGKLKE